MENEKPMGLLEIMALKQKVNDFIEQQLEPYGVGFHMVFIASVADPTCDEDDRFVGCVTNFEAVDLPGFLQELARDAESDAKVDLTKLN